mgnify:FL=1
MIIHVGIVLGILSAVLLLAQTLEPLRETPIRMKGSASYTNSVEVYDSAATPALQSRFDSGGAFNTAKQVGSTLATGTAPFAVTSTTPVANLTAVPAIYNKVGTQQTAAHLVQDTCTLGTDCAVTLSGSAVFTSATSYTCVCEDDSAIAACRVSQTSGTAFTVTGTGTDVIRYICAGN